MKSKKDLADLLAIIDLSHKFQEVKRVTYKKGSRLLENDAEHSYQLALIAWYLADIHKLKLNKEKLFMYAIGHDLVEAYAGDVNFYDSKARSIKQENEAKAFKTIKATFPRFSSLHRTISAYETKKDKESKFIWALDKLLPILNIYLDGGRSWKKERVTLGTLHKLKKEKVAASKIVETYYDLIYKSLKEKEAKLFPK